MAFLTTGLIDNAAVSGVRPSSSLAVLIANNDSMNVTIQIEGFYRSGSTKIMYVEELFVLAAGDVAQRNYFAEFDSFEFQFTVSSQAVNLSVWGKDAAGNLTTAQRVVAKELNPF